MGRAPPNWTRRVTSCDTRVAARIASINEARLHDGSRGQPRAVAYCGVAPSPTPSRPPAARNRRSPRASHDREPALLEDRFHRRRLGGARHRNALDESLTRDPTDRYCSRSSGTQKSRTQVPFHRGSVRRRSSGESRRRHHKHPSRLYVRACEVEFQIDEGSYAPRANVDPEPRSVRKARVRARPRRRRTRHPAWSIER
jgi:hypothetical protein